MSYYHRLNLPLNPFKDWNKIYSEVIEQFPPHKIVQIHHTIYDPAGLLKEELEETLASIGVKVSILFYFVVAAHYLLKRLG